MTLLKESSPCISQVFLQFLLCTALFGGVGAIVDMNSESWLLKGILLACVIGVINLATRWVYTSTDSRMYSTVIKTCVIDLVMNVCMKQEFSRLRLSVQPTSFKSHGFNLLDACHLVPLVYARYPLKKWNHTLKHFLWEKQVSTRWKT